MNFLPFKAAVAAQFELMLRQSSLYTTTVEPDDLWATYLSSFPPGSNPIYRSRTSHDCSCCRHFIKTIGSLASIVDNNLVSLWDITTDEPEYQTVADSLASLVKSHPIENIFLTSQRHFGTDRSFEKGEPVKVWDHFFLTVPLRNANPLIYPSSEIGPRLAEARATHYVLLRSLTEISIDSIQTVLDLIRQNSLYRGEEHKFALTTFLSLKREFDRPYITQSRQDLFTWERMNTVPLSVSRIRNTAIGTLLTDLSEGVDLEAAVRSYESKVAPFNYKRPTALVTLKMIDTARAKIGELGLTAALSRRYATLSDININNLLFVNREPPKALSADVFDTLPTKPLTGTQRNKLETINIEDFVTTVIPRVTSIEILFDPNLTHNLVSLIAPTDHGAPRLFKWPNPFSWSYNGDVTDSLRERVKTAGGNVTGDLCCRLAWHNYDDLDFHMVEPNGYQIYYGNRSRISPSGGALDVDMNAGRGTTREPVENIFYRTRATMRPGTYHLGVHQFSQRESSDIGFEVEIDYLGTTYSFAHSKVMRTDSAVLVAKLEYSHGTGIEIIDSLPLSNSSRHQSLWNIETNRFHKVNALMLSPNHWDASHSDRESHTGIGNRHYFFMIDGCQNDGQARGFYNEFLRSELDPHRKVIELAGSKLKTEAGAVGQLSGLGFSSTQHTEFLVKVSGISTRTLRITV